MFCANSKWSSLRTPSISVNAYQRPARPPSQKEWHRQIDRLLKSLPACAIGIYRRQRHRQALSSTRMSVQIAVPPIPEHAEPAPLPLRRCRRREELLSFFSLLAAHLCALLRVLGAIYSQFLLFAKLFQAILKRQ